MRLTKKIYTASDNKLEKLGDKLIPVRLSFEDITVRNIESNELNDVLMCINESNENLAALGRSTAFTYSDIEQRYLETLISPLEFFCGIYEGNQIIGIIKGRIENKNTSELWILSFLLSDGYRGKGLGTKTLKAFENYFLHNYSTEKLCILTLENCSNSHGFWLVNDYKLARVTKSAGSADLSMVIFEKKRKGYGQKC